MNEGNMLNALKSWQVTYRVEPIVQSRIALILKKLEKKIQIIVVDDVEGYKLKII